MTQPKLTDAPSWFESCDWCRNLEEGGHYCLLHSTVLKNTDTICCPDWEENPDLTKEETE